MRAAIQALKLLTLGLTLGGVLGVVFGFPRVEAPGADQGICYGPVPSAPDVQWITPEQARVLLNDPQVRFVDARDHDAFQRGHIAGALHVPLEGGVLGDAQLARLAPGRTIIAYCDTQGSCSASRRLAGLLSAAGFKDVRVLEGGMPAWMHAKFPAQAGACEDC